MVSYRTEQTTRSIMSTARDIVIHEGFTNLKVSTVCERVGISRMGFYYHYRDKYALINNIIRDDYNDLFRRNHLQADNWKRGGKLMLLLLKENEPFYRSIFDVNGYESFKKTFGSLLHEGYLNWLVMLELDSDLSLDYAAEFFVGATLHIISRWFESRMQDDIPYLMDQIELILKQSIFTSRE